MGEEVSATLPEFSHTVHLFKQHQPRRRRSGPPF
jgi:hypothetical protein